MAEGQTHTKADFVIYTGIDIPGHSTAPLCAHSANMEISSVKLILNFCSSLPGGGLGDKTALQHTAASAYKEHQACISH